MGGRAGHRGPVRNLPSRSDTIYCRDVCTTTILSITTSTTTVRRLYDYDVRTRQMRHGGNVDFSNSDDDDNDNDNDDFATVAGLRCFMRGLCLRPSLSRPGKILPSPSIAFCRNLNQGRRVHFSSP